MHNIMANILIESSHCACCDINDSEFKKNDMHKFVYFNTYNHLIAPNELQLTYK